MICLLPSWCYMVHESISLLYMEKLVCGICVFIGVFLISSCAATTYIVGDTAGWDISADLDTWPIDKNFTVGDVLMFQYSQSHSVSEVTKESYDGCNTTVTLRTYTGGNSNVTLTKPGDMYFICGNKLHCLGGMKLQMYVQEGQVVAYAPAPAPSAGRFELPKPSTKKNNNPARTSNHASSACGLEYSTLLMMIISAMVTFFITCI